MNKIQNKGRIETFDIAKGIGIILVYIGHVPPTADVRSFIYSFHMPLFFFLSGLFINEVKRNPEDFIIAKAKTLLVPLTSFVIFSILVGWIIEGNLTPIHWGINSALWFLPVLFVSETIVYMICRMVSKTGLRYVCLLMLISLSLICSSYHAKLPFALNSCPLAASFLLLGKLSVEVIKNNLKIRKVFLFWEAILGLVGIFFATVMSTNATNVHNGHIIWSGYLIAIVGIATTLVISRAVELYMPPITSAIKLCGKNSLVIFGTHLTLIEAFGISSSMFRDNCTMYILLNVIVILCMVLITNVINKYAPYLIGKF